ncbi:uncharacterized protein CELE_T08H10.3 [Caenorhabditis elegans]|uniref:Uncharacterized protein n=2 Tax=Caenorhabditis elegans TaxID=6239 RepID=Q22349_CAEEL|nr:Uncharacterized protein CELE_T08H10.3 [Caenorhabditis elegans]CCD72270.1 Uncharacterized protein CELE_T08H10.3 [Caenorhabditis elegans]|eukprot:NP_504229.1 Uncharacterized protein CELE_T08H10.3 [Caenorhabditis elegans]
MRFGDYFNLVQNLFLILLVFCPAWILCKGKKKATYASVSKQTSSAEPAKSAIKPPITDPTPSAMAKVGSDEKKEDPKDDKGDTKSPVPDGGAADAKPVDQSQKPFPKFEMPTESKKKKKMAENEVDKKEKMKNGFYQEKSDEDDTLEKVASLKVEQSDKTKRSKKNKK